MKTILVAVLATTLVGGIWYLTNVDFSQNYEKETIEKFIDNTPSEFKDCPECIEAAQNALRKKELEAELSQLESEVVERQARIEEIEAELSF